MSTIKKPTALTSKNYNSRLNGYFKSESSRRDTMQAFISFGVLHYGGQTDKGECTKGDTTLLSALMKGCVGVKSLPSLTIKDYIKEHANVSFVKTKDGTFVFKKRSKNEDVSIMECLTPWYEWEGGHHNKAKPDFDLLARFKSVLTAFETAKKKGQGIKTIDAKEADALKTRIDGMLA